MCVYSSIYADFEHQQNLLLLGDWMVKKKSLYRLNLKKIQIQLLLYSKYNSCIVRFGL
jgi:hypothetical protein